MRQASTGGVPASSRERVYVSLFGETALPDVLGRLGIVVYFLGAILHVVHIEFLHLGIQYGLHTHVVRLVGIHGLAYDDVAQVRVAVTLYIARTAICTNAVGSLHDVVVAQALVNLCIIVVVVGICLIADAHISDGAGKVNRRWAAPCSATRMCRDGAREAV